MSTLIRRTSARWSANARAASSPSATRCASSSTAWTPTNGSCSSLYWKMNPNDLVLISGGEFLMGQSDGRDEERPVHRVRVAPFRLCRYQVTNQDFGAFSHFAFDDPNKPVTSVNWF